MLIHVNVILIHVNVRHIQHLTHVNVLKNHVIVQLTQLQTHAFVNLIVVPANYIVTQIRAYVMSLIQILINVYVTHNHAHV